MTRSLLRRRARPRYSSIHTLELWAGALALAILLAVALATVAQMSSSHAEQLATNLCEVAEDSADRLEHEWAREAGRLARPADADSMLRLSIARVERPGGVRHAWVWVLLEDGRVFPRHDGEVERFWAAPSGIARLHRDLATQRSGTARFPAFVPRKLDALSSYASFQLADGTRGQWVITIDRAATVAPFFRVALVMGVGAFLAIILVVAGFVRVLEDLRRAHQAQRETNMLQAAILDGAEHAIISTDTQGVIQTWSAGAERLLGYSARETTSRMRIGEILDSLEFEHRRREVESVLGTPVSTDVGGLIAYAALGRADGREWTYRRRDGSPVPVTLEVSTLEDPHRRLTGFLVVSTDVTERKAVEADLRRARDAAEAAVQAKSEFLATMSHEIRTPLHGVIGMAGLLLETPLDPVQLDYSATIRSSAETLLALVNEILDFSKIESGQLALESIEFSVSAVTNDVFDMVAGRARAAGLDFACLLDPRVPDRVLGDPTRLRQVLLNLVDNAIKFTPEGSVVVRVGLETGPAAGRDAIRFSVTDSGIGLPAGKRDRLFQPFTQGDGSTTRRYGGTGLGLAICRRLVELMAGRMGVISEPGLGSTFWLSIPLARAGEDVVPAPARDPASKRVLLLSPSPPTRALLEEMLAHLGVRSVTVRTRGEALAELRRAALRDPYRVVLVHCVPGSRDWVDLPHERKPFAELAELEFCLLTADGSLAHRSTAVQLGYADVILLPVRQDQLCATLAARFDPAMRAERRPRAGCPQLNDEAVGDRKRFRILVAEDNPVNQKVVRGILRRLGYRVDCVANGHEAVAAVRDTRYDLVLMDCLMPEMDGFSATAAIRTLPGPRLPIVALTANAMQGDRERCLAAGMDEYMAKPLHVATLDAVLQRLLSSPATADARPAA